MRIHADLHLGQVLISDDGYRVIDFEGEPLRPIDDRRRPDSPLRDVASMLRSLDHVARSARRRAERRAGGPIARPGLDVDAWIERARDRFLGAYADGLRRAGAPIVVDLDLLDAFEVAKEAYEFVYAATVLPSWLWAPREGMRWLLDGATRMAAAADRSSAPAQGQRADLRQAVHRLEVERAAEDEDHVPEAGVAVGSERAATSSRRAADVELLALRQVDVAPARPRASASARLSRMTRLRFVERSISRSSRPDRRARLAQDGVGGGERRGRPVRVPQVGVPGDHRDRLARPGAADEDRQPRLDRPRLADGVGHRVVPALVGDALAVEQAPDQRHGLAEPVEPLAEPAPELEAERVVLPFEPAAADAEDRPPAADVVERRGQLGREPGVAERVGGDEQAQANPAS